MIRNVVFIFVNNIHDSISQMYEIRISIADFNYSFNGVIDTLDRIISEMSVVYSCKWINNRVLWGYDYVNVKIADSKNEK